jgi:flagellar basal body-associated protein FliL
MNNKLKKETNKQKMKDNFILVCIGIIILAVGIMIGIAL